MMARLSAGVFLLTAGKAIAFSGSPRAVEVSLAHDPLAVGFRSSLLAVEHAAGDNSCKSPSTATMLIGACVAAAAALRLSSYRSSGRGQREAVIVKGKVSPSGWKFAPIEGRIKQGVEGAPPRGPSYRPWITMRHKAKRGQRYHRQQKILKESGIQSANGGWHKWYPHQQVFNLYQGPESHPDNPWFPAASPGYDKSEMGPPRNGFQTRSPYLVNDAAAPTPGIPATPKVDDSPATQTEAFASVFVARDSFASGGALAAGRAPILSVSARSKTLLGGRASRRSVIMHAHKKAASSTKNQGHKQNAQFYGLTKKGYQGNAVKAGTIIARQKGNKWYAGKNVKVGKNFTLSALKDGIVQWRGNWKHKEVVVVPWQYVREKCKWLSPNKLGPKKYEPWMGTLDHNKRVNSTRDRVLKMRAEWLETDEGKEWLKKKTEKATKQREIQKKIRAIRKAKRAERESVPAESAGESEA